MPAIDFPSSPTNGQTFTSGSKTYTYNGTGWVLSYVAANAGGDLTGTYPNPTIATGAVTGAKLASISTNVQNVSYALVLGDRGKLIEMNVASANTLTVPTNANAAFAVGDSVDILQTGAGQTTIVGDSGVTVNATPGLKLRAQWSSATLIKRATNTWVAVGDLST